MNTKFRKWKFAPSRKIFIKEKRLLKLINNDKVTIYDTRDAFAFKAKKIKTSFNVSPSLIKQTIEKHSNKDAIVLVGKELRTNATIASWARFEGYKRVYLIDKSIKLITNKELLK